MANEEVMGGEAEGVWSVVKRRKQLARNRKFDVAKSSGHEEKYGMVSYFFTNIPDNFLAEDMFKVFEKYGRVVEVIIPAKRDKLGKRFGFARFMDVRDVEFFAVKLDNIIIGNTKIFVNFPRFDRGTKGTNAASRTDQSINQWKDASKNRHHYQNMRTQNRSFADAVKSNRNSGKPVVKKQVLQRFKRKDNKAKLVFDIADETVKSLGNAYVGEVSIPGTAYRILNEFTKQGYFTIKVSPMGANLVLLESNEDADISSLLTDGREWLLKWFDSVRPWHPREIDNERLTWIRCYGIPAHAWSNEFFQFLVAPLGTFVDVDDNTRNRKTMDVARVLYMTTAHDVINKIVPVQINGLVFSIKIVEDWYDPLQWLTPDVRMPSEGGSEDDSGESEFSFPAKGEGSEYSDDDDNNYEATNSSTGDGTVFVGMGDANEGHIGKDCVSAQMQRSNGGMSIRNNNDVVMTEPKGHTKLPLVNNDLLSLMDHSRNPPSGPSIVPSSLNLIGSAFAFGAAVPLFPGSVGHVSLDSSRTISAPFVNTRRNRKMPRRAPSNSATLSDAGGLSSNSGQVATSSNNGWRVFSTSAEEKIWLQDCALGIAGEEKDEVYIAAIKEMEDKEREAKLQRESRRRSL